MGKVARWKGRADEGDVRGLELWTKVGRWFRSRLLERIQWMYLGWFAGRTSHVPGTVQIAPGPRCFRGGVSTCNLIPAEGSTRRCNALCESPFSALSNSLAGTGPGAGLSISPRTPTVPTLFCLSLFLRSSPAPRSAPPHQNRRSEKKKLVASPRPESYSLAAPRRLRRLIHFPPGT